MKYSVRGGCFETNSSSVHSVVILSNRQYEHFGMEDIKGGMYDKGFIPLASNTYTIDGYDLEFGRQFEVLYTVYQKVCYTFASLYDSSEPYSLEKLKIEILGILNSTGCDYAGIDISEGDLTHSIDPQSKGVLRNFLKSKRLSLKEFILNKEYVVITDDDEDCVLPKMEVLGMLNKDNIVGKYNNWSDKK